RRHERQIGRIDGRAGAGSSAAAEDFVVPDIELAKQPIEAELFQIVLVDLDKFRFDLDLLRTGNARLFDNGVHQLKIVGGIANNQAATLRQKMRARSLRKRNALTFEKFSRAFSIDQLTTAGRFLRVFACSS